ncbi:hypothetical protein AN416_30690 (plasmid) [Paraburkholderia caribensis]|nr:hypothetical protein AN416_30690 [Paraburkholderia caribensis]
MPVQALLFIVMAVASAVILRMTRYGRHVYAVGGNAEAARLSGVPVDRIRVIAYCLSGLFAGLGGLVMSTQLNIGEANLGKGLELDAIAAVVVGGTSLSGGAGGIGGTIVGVLLIGVLNNLLNLLNIPAYTQLIVKGAITMVSGDNRALGVDAGQYIVETLTKKYGKPKGNIVLLEGIPGDETSVNRIGGVTSVTGKSADIKVIAKQPADYRRPKAYAVMQNILQAHPAGTVDLVFAANGEMALGAIQAIKESGRSSEIKVLGLDGQKEEFEAIRAGDEAATWLYPPAGTESMAVALKILKGEKVPPKVVLPTVRVTKENIDSVKPAF